MEIRSKLSILKGKIWYIISFILVSSALVLMDLTQILPSFVGTKMIIYGVVLTLFVFAIRAKKRHQEIKNENKRKA